VVHGRIHIPSMSLATSPAAVATTRRGTSRLKVCARLTPAVIDMIFTPARPPLTPILQSGASFIAAVDVNASKFEIAKKLGATHCFNPKYHDFDINLTHLSSVASTNAVSAVPCHMVYIRQLNIPC